jgi:hypothetical protein
MVHTSINVWSRDGTYDGNVVGPKLVTNPMMVPFNYYYQHTHCHRPSGSAGGVTSTNRL